MRLYLFKLAADYVYYQFAQC